MDKIDWRLLRELYREKSISKASEKLFLSQPAVSYRMSHMEREFGETLFLRSNKGVAFTSAGLRLHSFAGRMLRFDEEVHAYVRQANAGLSGTITVGSTATFTDYYLAPQLRAFCELHPGIDVVLRTASSFDQLRMLESGELRVGVIRGLPWNGPSFDLFDETLIAVSNEPITEKSLRTKPLIRSDGQTATTPLIDEWMAEHFDRPPRPAPVLLKGGGSRNLVHLVKSGIGWAVISRSRLFESDGLYECPICRADGSLFAYRTRLCFTEESGHFDPYRAYIDHFERFFRDDR